MLKSTTEEPEAVRAVLLLPLSSLLLAVPLAGAADLSTSQHFQRGGAAEPRAETAPVPASKAGGEPTASELAERWFDQLLGFDSLEAYELRSGRARIGFAVARKWTESGVEIVIYLRKPEQYDKLALLFRPIRGGPDDLFIYLTPQLFGASSRRVRRLPSPRLLAPVPAFGTHVPLMDFRPFFTGELTHERLPDEVIGEQACRVVESRPNGIRLGFDRMDLALSKRSGVSLRSRYFKGEKEILRVEVSPEDVARYDDRWLPTLRRLSWAGSAETGELILRNVIVDADLPDRLFTNHALRFQRFPSF